MNKPVKNNGAGRFAHQVGARATRKLQGQNEWSVWSGLGFMGMVGWSLALPVLLGAALGHWLDRHLPEHFSWSLWLILLGLVLGAWNAWRWVNMTGIVDSPDHKEGDHD